MIKENSGLSNGHLNDLLSQYCPKCGSNKTVIYPTCSDRVYCAKCGEQLKKR